MYNGRGPKKTVVLVKPGARSSDETPVTDDLLRNISIKVVRLLLQNRLRKGAKGIDPRSWRLYGVWWSCGGKAVLLRL